MVPYRCRSIRLKTRASIACAYALEVFWGTDSALIVIAIRLYSNYLICDGHNVVGRCQILMTRGCVLIDGMSLFVRKLVVI